MQPWRLFKAKVTTRFSVLEDYESNNQAFDQIIELLCQLEVQM